MDDVYIYGLLISGVLALIGILYKGSVKRTEDNSKEIKRVDEKTDGRLDIVEKDIVEIQTKIDK